MRKNQDITNNNNNNNNCNNNNNDNNNCNNNNDNNNNCNNNDDNNNSNNNSNYNKDNNNNYKDRNTNNNTNLNNDNNNNTSKYININNNNNLLNANNNKEIIINNTITCKTKYKINKKQYPKREIDNTNIKSNQLKKQKLNIKFVEPITYKDIFNCDDKTEWLTAVNEELNNMKKLNVYKTVKELPYKTNIISSKWIFKYKKDSEGRITKRKARLVARGFSQKYGIDFKETFSPNLKHDSLRIFTAFAAQKIFKREQIDINAAYLNANLTEEVYMKPPEGHLDYNNKFWKLNKTIYGLKQSGRE